MKNPPAVKGGDRVRVVIETEASGSTGSAYMLGTGNEANWVNSHAEHVVSVEVLKPPVKVGDVIAGGDFEKFESLPDGAVLRHEGSKSLLFKAPNGWYGGDGRGTFSSWTLHAARTVVYLPEVAA